MRKSETVICTYRVKKGKEPKFLELLHDHWPTLRKLRLVTDVEPLIFRGEDKERKTFFVEVFTWKDSAAVDAAHRAPEVQAIWGPMEQLVEERLGRPGREIAHVEPIEVR